MANINEISLVDLLPPSIKDDSNVMAAAKSLDVELQKVLTAINSEIIIPNISNMPESVIDLLAWQYHVDFYDSTLPLEIKRSLVLKSIDWHKRKGTPSVVREMVSSVLSNGVVKEWFEYGGQPYYFQVETDDVMNDQTIYDRLIKLVNAVKNCRSWLEKIIIKRECSGNLFIGGALYSAKTLTINPAKFVLSNGSAPLFIGGVLLSGKSMTIHPEHFIVEAQGEIMLQFGGAILNGKTVTIQ